MNKVITTDFLSEVCTYVEQAKESVKIMVYDWRWYPNDGANPVSLFNQTLVRASRRGVDVRGIVNSDVVARALREAGLDVKKYNRHSLLHLKCILIDEKILITGSHNLTVPGLTMNHELSIIVDDQASCNFVARLFSDLWLS